MTLDQLCSRAPWSGVSTRGWGTEEPWELTEAEVRAAYSAIQGDGGRKAICEVLGVDGLSHDKANRCLQLLRKAGLVKYHTSTGWVPRGTV